MTAAVFGVMSVMARKANVDTNALGRFLSVGGVILMIAVVANLFLQMPVFGLAIAGAFVFFSSLVIMWQVRTVIEGGAINNFTVSTIPSL